MFHRTPFFMDETWLLLVPVKTTADLQPTAFANKVCSNAIFNEQVKTCVCINFDDNSANVTLLNSRMNLKIFGCLRVICILTKVYSLAT